MCGQKSCVYYVCAASICVTSYLYGLLVLACKCICIVAGICADCTENCTL